MSTTERSESASPARTAAPAAAPSVGTVRHPRSFKLRFAVQRVPGHSYQSAVRPLALPALVTDKFWRRVGREEEPLGAGDAAGAEARALTKVKDMFARGPREKHARPVQASHDYGWWNSWAPRLWAAPRGDRRLQHHVRDSEWLKVRLRVLAEAPPAARRR